MNPDDGSDIRCSSPRARLRKIGNDKIRDLEDRTATKKPYQPVPVLRHADAKFSEGNPTVRFLRKLAPVIHQSRYNPEARANSLKA